ncbi:hypothetical protein BpHYR1_023331 [Brachionus plicatilis]|uniref:Transmembrane protein n=1 Tax=Brachionus plicatilis TaxID=10195 RepID=A0A3M7SRD4_BRAPC|nr:hypothetical protein BpHYR1_023331 [Brachionus plicatilis]
MSYCAQFCPWAQNFRTSTESLERAKLEILPQSLNPVQKDKNRQDKIVSTSRSSMFLRAMSLSAINALGFYKSLFCLFHPYLDFSVVELVFLVVELVQKATVLFFIFCQELAFFGIASNKFFHAALECYQVIFKFLFLGLLFIDFGGVFGLAFFQNFHVRFFLGKLNLQTADFVLILQFLIYMSQLKLTNKYRLLKNSEKKFFTTQKQVKHKSFFNIIIMGHEIKLITTGSPRCDHSTRFLAKFYEHDKILLFQKKKKFNDLIIH